MARRDFGVIRKLPSGRYQAFYRDPDGRMATSRTGKPTPLRHAAPHTFDTKGHAEAWLVDERRLISSGLWSSPKDRAAARLAKPLTFGEFAEPWLANRETKGRPLADRTREHYRQLLDAHILPTFEDVPLAGIEPEHVDRWYATLTPGKPTTRAHAYSLLRTILGSAVDRRLITQANPARIRGAGNVERAREIRPATLDELEIIAAHVPQRHKLLVLLAAWCALRFGELAALQRSDLDTKNGVIRVRRGVVRTKSGQRVKTPKTRSSIRDVNIPPHLLPLVREHLLAHAAPGRDGLLFPGKGGAWLQPSTFYGKSSVIDAKGNITRTGHGFYYARQAAGREDLAFHHLRHTGAVLAAATGATLAELMARLGHSTQGAALRYQHAAAGRDAEIAARLSEIATGGRA